VSTNNVGSINLNNSILRNIINQFKEIKINALSGNTIVLVESEPSRMFTFNSGKLMGISGGIDLIDRWDRNLAIAKLKSPADVSLDCGDDRTIPLAVYIFAQKLVTIEILFDLIQICECTRNKLSYQFISIDSNNLSSSPNLTLLDIQPILAEAIQSWQEWEKAGLAAYFPNEFLIIRDYPQLFELIDIDSSLEILLSIDGKKSLRNFAVDAGHNLLEFTTQLLPLLTEHTISLSSFQIDRMKSNNLEYNLSESFLQPITQKVGYLIAYIDSNISVYKNLQKFFSQQGYQSYGVQDSRKVIPTLIENKPDLIFLDLLMPIITGYEICQQIQKISLLKDIPIVIITTKDGLFDRMGAKAIGANEFLSKPISYPDVLEILAKYL
jgi:two-component system, chemotaxis family, response regulator PixG